MTNIANLLTEHIDIWTAADTEKKSGRGRASGNSGTVYGVKKLRELILELAVRGKLVPQDPNDEPAKELLKRIHAEKAKLISEDKLKKEKPLVPIGEDEKQFELPIGWEWARLQDVYDVRDGTHDTPKYTETGFPLVTSKNLYSGTLDFSDIKYISEQDHLKIKERSKVDKGDILFAMIGSIGNPVIVDTDLEFSIKNVALFKPYSANLSNTSYLLKYLIKAAINLREEAAGAVQSFVSLGVIRNYLLPLPPLTEQHRIVAKVDELMALCDQLEQQHSNAQEAHEALVSQLLATLTQSQNAAEFNANWQRIYAHFDVLFTTEASIDTLKQTLLQLAVMGKLVPQDPNDEPASELITRTKAFFKEEFETEFIKLSRDESIFNPESYHFSLPNSWVWCELQDISMFFNGKAHEMFVDPNGKYTLVNSSFISNDGDKVKKVSECLFPLQIGDLAIVMSDVPNGRALVRCFKVDEAKKYSLNQRIGCLRFPKFFNIDYLRIVIERNKYYLDYDDGKKQTNLKKIQVLSCPIPLPPIEEQHRIVAKVDTLMALCDQLKTRIQQANQQQQTIADALVAQAVA